MPDINHPSISDVFGWTCSPVWKKFALDKNGVFEKGNIIREQNIRIKKAYSKYSIIKKLLN